MIIALVLLAVLVQRLATRQTHPALLSLIALCAGVSAISALVRYYDVQEVRWLQPILATCIPPTAWLAFSRAADGQGQGSARWLHALAPIATLVLVVFYADALDFLIPLTFTAYGAAMLLRLGKGEDSLIHTSLEHGAASLWAWRIVGLSLIASAVADVIISVTLARGDTGPLLWLPTIASALSLLSLGVLSLTHAIESQRDDGADEQEAPALESERDRAIVAQLDDYVARQKPYLDPDLTLSRLARRLVIPAKQLSAAINRVKGENVSRFINRHRIEEACGRMSARQPVTTAMLESGFMTKSNFNREFQRVKGMSPSQWLNAQKALADPG
jgi:AraC-like DNA-binding protein